MFLNVLVFLGLIVLFCLFLKIVFQLFFFLYFHVCVCMRVSTRVHVLTYWLPFYHMALTITQHLMEGDRKLTRKYDSRICKFCGLCGCHTLIMFPAAVFRSG